MEKSPALKEVQEQEERKVRRVPDLKVIQGGGGPSNPNWIEDLPVGATFLYCTKTPMHPQDVGVNCAQIVCKFRTSTRLYDSWAPGENYYGVNNSRFSNSMRLLEVLEPIDGEQE
jgi:hypothetical protein